VKLISKVKIVYFILILFFISLFIQQQVYAQFSYVNGELLLQLEYSENWKFNKDTQSGTGPENAKLLIKKVSEMVYPVFNPLYFSQFIPYNENNGFVSVLDDNTIYSVTLYPNMSSLADTRVYTNLSSFGDKVFPNVSSLESSKVFPNVSSLADTRVYTNISSLSQ